MDIVKKTVLFVVVLVIGTLLITYLIPPATDAVLARPDTAGYTGLEQFLRLLPFLAVVALVVGGILILFGRGDGGDTDTGHDAGLPPGYTRPVRLPWRRR